MVGGEHLGPVARLEEVGEGVFAFFTALDAHEVELIQQFEGEVVGGFEGEGGSGHRWLLSG